MNKNEKLLSFYNRNFDPNYFRVSSSENFLHVEEIKHPKNCLNFEIRNNKVFNLTEKKYEMDIGYFDKNWGQGL